MPRIVYVPQGYCARLNADAPNTIFQGLYTDRFSTCNLIVCMGTNGVTLIHADMQTSPQLVANEIRRIGENSTVALFYRPNDGEAVRSNILEYLKFNLPSQTITSQQVDSSNDGIFIPIQARNKSDIKICPLDQRPEELIRHPKEEQLLTIQKIGQIIGVRARDKAMKANGGRPVWQVRPFCLFDGLAWEHIDENMLKIDTSNGITNEEVESFKSNEPTIVIGGRLGGIIEHALRGGIELGNYGSMDIAISVMPYMANYLYGYNHMLIFQLDMRDVVNQQTHKPSTQSDKELKKELNKILGSADLANLKKQVDECIARYRNSVSSVYNEQVFREYEGYTNQYEEREKYKNLVKELSDFRKSAKAESQKGSEFFIKKDYNNAISCNSKALQLYSYCCSNNEASLVHAYYNYAMTLYNLGRMPEAVPFFRKIIQLKEGNPNIAPHLTNDLIADIKKKLSVSPQQNVNTSASSASGVSMNDNDQMLLSTALTIAGISGISANNFVGPLNSNNSTSTHQGQSSLNTGVLTPGTLPSIVDLSTFVTSSQTQQVLSSYQNVDEARGK